MQILRKLPFFCTIEAVSDKVGFGRNRRAFDFVIQEDKRANRLFEFGKSTPIAIIAISPATSPGTNIPQFQSDITIEEAELLKHVIRAPTMILVIASH